MESDIQWFKGALLWHFSLSLLADEAVKLHHICTMIVLKAFPVMSVTKV